MTGFGVTFSLEELTRQTVLRFGQKQFKLILKLILKLFVAVIAFQHQTHSSHSRTFSKSRPFVEICGSDYISAVHLKSGPQRETQTQQHAWFSWHGVACSAACNSQK